MKPPHAPVRKIAGLARTANIASTAPKKAGLAEFAGNRKCV
jgi:hypothetical protein